MSKELDFDLQLCEIFDELPMGIKTKDEVIKHLKALEIIKEKLTPYVEKYRDLGYTVGCNMLAIGISEEEYELLKEVLK